jgi:hypothetical protein
LADFEIIPILTYLNLTDLQKNLVSNSLDRNDFKIRPYDGTPMIFYDLWTFTIRCDLFILLYSYLEKNLANVAHVLDALVKLVELEESQVGLQVVTDLLGLNVDISGKKNWQVQSYESRLVVILKE